MNCFFKINKQDVEYNNLQIPSPTEETWISGWPKVALDIIKEAFYYKNIQENKLCMIHLLCGKTENTKKNVFFKV